MLTPSNKGHMQSLRGIFYWVENFVGEANSKRKPVELPVGSQMHSTVSWRCKGLPSNCYSHAYESSLRQ